MIDYYRRVPLGGRYYVQKFQVRSRASGYQHTSKLILVHDCDPRFPPTPILMRVRGGRCVHCRSKSHKDVVARACWWARGMGEKLHGWEMRQANLGKLWKRYR